MPKVAYRPEEIPPTTSPFSAGIRAGNLVFTSGQAGSKDRRTGQALTTIEEQTRETMERVKAILEGGGASLNDVVKVTVFLTRKEDFAKMNEVYRSFFPKDPPARSTVEVSALMVSDMLVEIEAMAVIPGAQ
jgi:2-iminobutanoate/2-iminopropanoate deaminase